MKKIYVILFLIFTITVVSFGQPLTYSDVIIVDSVTSKEELFDRARVWFANNFRDSKEVLRASNKENGELMGTGAIPFTSSLSGSMVWRSVFVPVID